MRPLFSIIIPTCNRPELLRACLNKLLPETQKWDQNQYEIIVTNDAEINIGLIQKIFPNTKCVQGPCRGPAANRNNGSKYAFGDWLLFLDDDCLPDPCLLNSYKEAIENNEGHEIFEGKIYCNSERQSLDETSPINITGGYLWSCNFLIKKKVFDKLGGFDERFPYAAMEDVDFKLRLEKEGYKILFVPDAGVEHPWRKKGGYRKLNRHAKSTLIFLKLHPEKKKEINSLYYLRATVKKFTGSTVPGVFKYKGKGIKSALIEHIIDLKMMVRLLF